MTTFTYGKSGSGNYAVAKGKRTHGVWDAVEVPGDFYRILESCDDVPECDMDRIDALEAEAEAR